MMIVNARDFADATGLAYDASIAGLELPNIPGVVDEFIKLRELARGISFEDLGNPMDYFDEGPWSAIAIIRDTPEAMALLTEEQKAELPDVHQFVDAWEKVWETGVYDDLYTSGRHS